MTRVLDSKPGSSLMELVTFYVGEALCGIDILKVQEINKMTEMTGVPRAPEYVLGILNLRGRIITVIDLGRKLGLSSAQRDDKSRNIIVNSRGEYIGLLVDRVADVTPIDRTGVAPSPSNVRGVQGRLFEGVFKAEHGLIAILDVEEVLRVEDY